MNPLIDKYGFRYYKDLPEEYSLGKSMFLVSFKASSEQEVKDIESSLKIRNKYKEKLISDIKSNPNSYEILPNQEFLLYSELQDRYDLCITSEHNERYTDMLEWKKFIKPWIDAKRFYVKKK